MIAALLLALAAAGEPQPTYLVERVVTLGGEVHRTSVFRNGVAVFTDAKPGKAKRVLRQPLTDVELGVLAQIAEQSYDDLARVGGPVRGPGEGSVELRLAPLGKPPLVIRYAVSAVPPLAAARIGQALDGLEASLARLPATREDLRAWVPSVGDKIELTDGRIVEVLEVLTSGDGLLVRVRIGDGPATMFLAEEELRRLALRRVER